MNPGRLLTLMSVCGLSVSANTISYAANAASAQQYDPKILAQIEEIYGLSEEAALTRLANEYEAAVQAQSIEALNIPSYAGAWFDSATQRPHVAVSSTKDFAAIEDVGAIPMLVDHSLAQKRGRGTFPSHEQQLYPPFRRTG